MFPKNKNKTPNANKRSGNNYGPTCEHRKVEQIFHNLYAKSSEQNETN